MEFKEIKLCDLYNFSSGLSKGPEDFGFGFPFLSFMDIFHSPYIKENFSSLVNSNERERKTCSICKGDVFLTRTSETVEELGMSTVALHDFPDATFNGFAKRLRPKNDLIVPEYAAYYFRSKYFRAQAMGMASIITRASLNNTMMNHLTIRYPSKEEQSKIGTILFNYDKLIEKNEERIDVLKKMCLEYFNERLIRNRNNEERIETRLGEHIKFVNGFAFKSESYDEDGLYRVITIKNVQDQLFDLSSCEKVKDIPQRMDKKCLLKKGDILLSLTGNVGRVCIVTEDNCLLNQRVAKIETKYPFYFYHLFLGQELFCYMNNIANGTAQLNLSPVKLQKYKFCIPSTEAIEEFENFCRPIFQLVQKLTETNSLLNKQKEMIFDRLYNGEIELIEKEIV